MTPDRSVRSRQAVEMATLSEAVSNLHRGVKALRAENADLRGRVLALTRAGERAEDRLVETTVEAGPRAPGLARRVTAGTLGDHVAERVLANAQLVMSELVTNSVRHSGASAGDELVVRLRIWRDHCRLEVEDAGHDGVIAPRSPDLAEGNGMGLALVQQLSERWGLVRASDGPTRVWAQLHCGRQPTD